MHVSTVNSILIRKSIIHESAVRRYRLALVHVPGALRTAPLREAAVKRKMTTGFDNGTTLLPSNEQPETTKILLLVNVKGAKFQAKMENNLQDALKTTSRDDHTGIRSEQFNRMTLPSYLSKAQLRKIAEEACYALDNANNDLCDTLELLRIATSANTHTPCILDHVNIKSEAAKRETHTPCILDHVNIKSEAAKREN